MEPVLTADYIFFDNIAKMMDDAQLTDSSFYSPQATLDIITITLWLCLSVLETMDTPVLGEGASNSQRRPKCMPSCKHEYTHNHPTNWNKQDEGKHH